MADYITVRIDKDDAVDMLINRLVDRWTDDDDVVELYGQMYENYTDNGVFEDQVFDVSNIVDNDYVNYCDVIDEDDYRYEEVKKSYEDGEPETDHGYVEAATELGDGTSYKFLVRTY